MSALNVHDDWLSLIEISGPFLAVPVLKEAFPQGLEGLDGIKKKRLRQAYEEWREALELEDAQFVELHAAWIEEVLSSGLDLDEDGKSEVLKRSAWCAANLKASLHEQGVTMSPHLAVVDWQRANKPLMLIQTYEQGVDLNSILKQDGWAATPADRMVALCRSLSCRLGLVTNGERWMVVDAPLGAVTSFASWYARIWSQEPITLQAFVHLLGIRRFFVDESEQLPALFDRSLKFQDEVTDALGEQVRRAVEVLIQTLDKADQDRNRKLLHDVKEPELYESALTVMMRLVFLLSAEERGLLLMGDERYEANYALSTLRMQLRKESEEILERRWDAWSRLLAIFRAIFGGIEHENLRLPAMGGSLFDPDRFPFLEGRAKGSSWRSDVAKPLPIDNRTVLLLLDAIQQFQGRTLSYRALDVEQIGYVYEGLLERTVKRTDEVTLELDATKSAKTPWVKLTELDSAQSDGAIRLAELLQERTGSSTSRLRNDLAKPVDDKLADRLLTACQGNTTLRDCVKPYAHLLRTDPWGYPLVYPAGAFIVTTGSDRRETGTHYTPKSLTEAIVSETLTPVAYVGPAEGKPREQWALKSPAELLDLKICDPAMGSGAFLVQACRWLSDRIVEAWSQIEALGKTVSVDGQVLEPGVVKETLTRDGEARTVIARRLVAERCLYGVDLNPLAVELAKLSIWLVTLAKGRPFGFLDHSLRCGDSLLGIHSLDQLTELSMNPGSKGQQRLFGQNIKQAVYDAIKLRQQLREMPIRDIHDVGAMERLDADARQRLRIAEQISDAFIGCVLSANGSSALLNSEIDSIVVKASEAIDGSSLSANVLSDIANEGLSIDLPIGAERRRAFHWPLEFPEVFQSKRSGFDAVVGNPPFLWGMRISTTFGSCYLKYLEQKAQSSLGAADLCVHFLLRADEITSRPSTTGFILVDTISQGDTREVGLGKLLSKNLAIIWAQSSTPWPGKASVKISPLVIRKGDWKNFSKLDGKMVDSIDSRLSDQSEESQPAKLKGSENLSFVGHYLMGQGFTLKDSEVEQLLKKEPGANEVIFDYLRGEDVNQQPTQRTQLSVINFRNRTLEECEQRFPITLNRIRELVKPERDLQKRKANRERWWQYAEQRPGLNKAIARLEKVIIQPFTSKYLSFTLMPARMVFASPMVVIASDDIGLLGVLHSSIHDCWVRKYSSRMGDRIRYASSDCFETFPFPIITDRIRNASKDFYHKRQTLLTALEIGVTSLINKLNDANEHSAEIQELRMALRSLDEAVVESYGWSDIHLEHGLTDASKDERFSISEGSRKELLRRLLTLNLQRHKEESLQSQAFSAKVKRVSKGRFSSNITHQMSSVDMFEGEKS
jgi:hypothetical protein